MRLTLCIVPDTADDESVDKTSRLLALPYVFGAEQSDHEDDQHLEDPQRGGFSADVLVYALEAVEDGLLPAVATVDMPEDMCFWLHTVDLTQQERVTKTIDV